MALAPCHQGAFNTKLFLLLFFLNYYFEFRMPKNCLKPKSQKSILNKCDRNTNQNACVNDLVTTSPFIKSIIFNRWAQSRWIAILYLNIFFANFCTDFISLRFVFSWKFVPRMRITYVFELNRSFWLMWWPSNEIVLIDLKQKQRKKSKTTQ